MNILLYNQSCLTTDLEYVLKRSGKQVTVITKDQKNYEEDEEFKKAVIDIIKKDSIHLIFSVNFYPNLSKLCNDLKLPYVSWIVDSPLLTLYSNTIHYEYNYVFVFDRMNYLRLKEIYNVKTVYYLPLAANTERLYNVHISSQQLEYFTADVSIMANLYSDNFFNEIKYLPPYIKGYIDGIMNAQLNVYGYTLLEDSLSNDVITEFRKHVKFDLGENYFMEAPQLIADAFLTDKCAELERFNIVNELSKYFNVTLYTPSDSSVFSNVRVRDYIDYDTDMPRVFKLSKININTTKRSIRSGIPLRVFDIMGAGGFLISNYQPELIDYFIPDKEIVLYGSIDELKDKVNYYLQHEEERKEIAHNGYLKVKDNHDYDNRLKQIFEVVNNKR